MANAAFQALLMFAMVMLATQAIYADRASGTTFTHWEVCFPSFFEAAATWKGPCSLAWRALFREQLACVPKGKE